MDYDGLPLEPEQMDILFFTDFGLKTVSPLVTNLNGDDETLSEANLMLIAEMLLSKYRNKWDRDNAVARAEYDPMHNYLDEYHEEGTINEDESEQSTQNEQWDETIDTNNTTTRTDNLTQGDSGSYSDSDNGTNAQNRFGLNSATAVPVTSGSDAVTSSGTNSNTRTNTGTQTIGDVRDEERHITDARTDNSTRDNDKAHEKDGYHKGNIGNISTQKLLLEEIDLWRWNLTDEILHDARDFLTIQIYVAD
jgi:hypothetical protein